MFYELSAHVDFSFVDFVACGLFDTDPHGPRASGLDWTVLSGPSWIIIIEWSQNDISDKM